MSRGSSLEELDLCSEPSEHGGQLDEEQEKGHDKQKEQYVQRPRGKWREGKWV